VLNIIHPKITFQLTLAKQVKVIEALQEVKLQETDLNWLPAEYSTMLDNAESIMSEFKQQPRQLEFIYNIISDLYLAKYAFKGKVVKNKLPELKSLLDNYNINTLKEFFMETLSNTN
jgi:Bardet-Biedl syndrome 7 protein